MITLWPRKNEYDVTGNTRITEANVLKLTSAAKKCYDAILEKNLKKFGHYVIESFNAQTTLFPSTLNDEIRKIIDQYKDKVHGWKLSGAGGGGYLILIAEKPVKKAIRIKIRRKAGY